MMQLEIEAQRAKNNSTSSVGGSGSGGGSPISDDNGSTTYQEIMRAIASGDDKTTLRNMVNSANLTEQERQELLDEIEKSNNDEYRGVSTATNGRDFQTVWAQVSTMERNGATYDEIATVLDNYISRGYITESQADYIAINLINR